MCASCCTRFSLLLIQCATIIPVLDDEHRTLSPPPRIPATEQWQNATTPPIIPFSEPLCVQEPSFPRHRVVLLSHRPTRPKPLPYSHIDYVNMSFFYLPVFTIRENGVVEATYPALPIIYSVQVSSKASHDKIFRCCATSQP